MDERTTIKTLLAELSAELKRAFQDINLHTAKASFNWNKNIDLSGIESRLMSALEKGETEQLSLILDQGVAAELKKIVTTIPPVMVKTYRDSLAQIFKAMGEKAQ